MCSLVRNEKIDNREVVLEWDAFARHWEVEFITNSYIAELFILKSKIYHQKPSTDDLLRVNIANDCYLYRRYLGNSGEDLDRRFSFKKEFEDEHCLTYLIRGLRSGFHLYLYEQGEKKSFFLVRDRE